MGREAARRERREGPDTIVWRSVPEGRYTLSTDFFVDLGSIRLALIHDALYQEGERIMAEARRWLPVAPRLISLHGGSPQNIVADNASEELVAFARAGKREDFDALAGCLMPAEEIAECWAGCRVRLNLAP